MTLRQFFHNRDTSLLATLALIFVSLVWGASFYLTKEVLAEVSVIDFLGLRYGLGTLVTAVAMYPFYRRASKTVWIHGFTIGSIYAFGQVLQTEGMNYASASVSGFMVSLYVAGTPLVGWLMFRTRVAHITKVAVALSLAGAAVLGLRGLALGYGEAMLIGCAIVFSLHVVLTGRYATAKDALALAAIQLMVTGIWLALVAAPGGIGVPHTTKGWVSLVFLVIGSGVLALLAQTWAQSRLPAARAAVIMALEPVFASAVAVGFGDEQVTNRLLLGGALMIAGMLLAEVGPSKLAAARLRKANAAKHDDVAARPTAKTSGPAGEAGGPTEPTDAVETTHAVAIPDAVETTHAVATKETAVA